MSTYNLRRFTEPAALKRFDPARLIEFLGHYSDYLAKRGVKLGRNNVVDIDYTALALVLATPDGATPRGLVESLYYVDEMATPHGMDALLDEIAKHRLTLPLGDKSTPADVAFEMWKARPDLLQRVHAERRLQRRRNFESFIGRRVPGRATKHDPTPEQMTRLKSGLSDWFGQRLRGSWCEINPYPDGSRTLYMVRHGDAMHREPSVTGGEPSVELYRPEKFDVVAYDSLTDELWINADDKILNEYRCQVGLHLFGDAEYFPRTDRFTLEPIRTDGRDVLACNGITGVNRIHLVELEYEWPGDLGETETRHAPDMFYALEKSRGIPDSVVITSAKFRVLYSESKQWRTVTLTIPNKVECRSDDRPLIEEWIRQRHFMIPPKKDDHSHDPILERPRDAEIPLGS